MTYYDYDLQVWADGARVVGCNHHFNITYCSKCVMGATEVFKLKSELARAREVIEASRPFNRGWEEVGYKAHVTYEEWKELRRVFKEYTALSAAPEEGRVG